MRILVAEDELLVRELAVRTLRGAGYEVVEATDGEHAVELFESLEGNVDLAVLDLVMPRCGGRDASRRMRSVRPELPVLFCSAYSDEWLSDIAGTHAFLHKPYRRNSLLGEVKRLQTQMGQSA